MTIFHTFRYLLSSIVVILDYQFQGSVIAIKQIPKRRCEKSIYRAKNETFRFTIFFTVGSCLDRTLFFFFPLVHCYSHARLSILRLGKCLYRNFSTPSINPIDYEGHISRPLEVQILFSGTDLAHIWQQLAYLPNPVTIEPTNM